ncbi:restriction endonuclease [Thermodesulfobacteriota bacterium]
MKEKMWMIRAGRDASLIQDFEDNGYVAVGWIEMDDLTNVKSKGDIEKIHIKAYPDQKTAKRRMSVGQMARFRFDIKEGDLVTTYNPEYRTYLVGEIVSDYQYIPRSPGDFNHIRKVNWQGKVKRDSLSVSTKNTVGAIMTLFLLSDSASKEFQLFLSGKAPVPEDAEDDKETEMDEIKKDVMERAFEFTKDMIQKLDWDEMQELVAGILRAMGYKTRVASPGPDRGADIIASPDGLGLEQPRIRVEVKHKSDSIGASLLRSFIGGLRQNDRGLYVSTGGFTKEARYEAERSTIPVTLIDIDELADLLINNYDNADTETKALVPLVKLYWPA